jgi:hypothetical protein
MIVVNVEFSVVTPAGDVVAMSPSVVSILNPHLSIRTLPEQACVFNRRFFSVQ